MTLQCGIVGLPNVGKSTLFNAMTAAGAAAENFPFCTIEPNVGVVAVADERMGMLRGYFNSQTEIPASIEFVDIAGLVAGASKGEGLGNQFLGNIRMTDAIIHVVRCFDNDNVVHVMGGVDPVRDVEIIETELILSDIDTLDKRLQKYEKMMKGGDKDAKAAHEVYLRIQKVLHDGRLAWVTELSDEERELIKDNGLLTLKPVLYVANVSENDLDGQSPHVAALRGYAAKEGFPVITISTQIEAEMSVLGSEERAEFLSSLGLAESGLGRLAKAAYDLLDLQTYFTCGPKEIHAWTFHRGMKAPQCAGIIHTDFERGFIRAEIYHYDDLKAANGSESKVKEMGKFRVEGKEYVMQDGDIVHFRFNV